MAWLRGTMEAAQADTVRRHMDGCPDCTAAMESLRAVDEALEDLRLPPGTLAPVGVEARATAGPETAGATLATEPTGESARTPLQRWAAMALAASLLALVGWGLLSRVERTAPREPLRLHSPAVLLLEGGSLRTGGETALFVEGAGRLRLLEGSLSWSGGDRLAIQVPGGTVLAPAGARLDVRLDRGAVRVEATTPDLVLLGDRGPRVVLSPGEVGRLAPGDSATASRDPEATWELAAGLWSEERRAEAGRLLESLAATLPEGFPPERLALLRERLGWCALEAGRPLVAADAFAAAAVLGDSASGPWEGLAWSWFRLGRAPEALRALHEAAARADRLTTGAGLAEAFDPMGAWAARRERGWVLLDAGEAAAARAAFDAALEAAPGDPGNLLGAGRARYLQGDHAGAARLLSWGVALRPTPDPLSWATLGWARYFCGEYHEALSAFERASELSAGTALAADPMEGTGWALLRLGQTQAAACSFRASLHIEPGRPSAAEGLHASLSPPPLEPAGTSLIEDYQTYQSP